MLNDELVTDSLRSVLLDYLDSARQGGVALMTIMLPTIDGGQSFVGQSP